MLKQINKTIEFPFLNWVSFGYIQKKKILILTSNNDRKYYVIPTFVTCSTKKSNLLLNGLVKDKNDLTKFNLFFTILSDLKKSINIYTKKKLKLKGLGLKTNLSSDSNFLELKLGYSHIIRIAIPKDKIKITIQKNFVVVEGFDKVIVGDFVSKLRSLKIPDSYKGKGFWYPYEKESFKVIKKK
jgi:large subunit ribosomal protein L6